MEAVHANSYKKRLIFRTVLPVSITVFLFLGTTYFLFIPYLENSLIRAKYEMVKELTVNVISIIETYEKQVQDGILSLEEAQRRVINRVREIRYGSDNKDYFWINDMHPKMIMHPYRTDLEGQDISNYTDPNGKRLFAESVKEVRQNGGGYVDYVWQWKDDATRLVPKISYVQGFEPWGWIVGTGIYIEDVREKIHEISRTINILFAGILAIIVLLSWLIIRQGFQTGQSIANQNVFLETLLSAIPKPVFYKDKNGRYLGCNPAFEEITGKQKSEIVGHTVHEVWPEQVSEVYYDKDLELLEKPGTQQYENILYSVDGSIRDVIFNKSSFSDLSGELTGIVGVIQDITEHKQAVLSLHQSEARLRAVIEASKDAMIAIDVEGKVLLFNPSAEKMFGYSKNEILGQPLDCIIPKEHRESHHQFIQSFVAIGQPSKAINNTLELPATHRDGAVFPIDLSLSEGISGDERFILAVIRDISERKKAEEALRESQYNLQRAHTIARFGSWQWTPSTHQFTASKETLELFGFSLTSDLIDQDQIRNIVHPDDKDFYQESWELFLTNKEKLDRTYRIQVDGEIKWIHSIAECELSNTGEIIRVIGTLHDITESKKAEIERRLLEDQLRQSQKMEAIGTLAGGIAHDFNNILFAIQGYLQLLKGDVPPDDSAQEWISQIQKASFRAQDLVKQILTFSRKGQQKRIQLQLNSLVKEVLKLLRSSIPTTIEIVSEIPKFPIYINADPTQIHQVIMNLASNAVFAMKLKGGKLEINLTLETVGTVGIESLFEKIKPGNYAKLTVRDTGSGIPAQVLGRIFEPFFTTKSEGEGTGMGLSVAHGIVKSHDGIIDLKSAMGRGTVFTIYLPVSTTPDTSADEKPEDDILISQINASILLVDDETGIVEAWKEQLRRIGFKVTGFTNSLDALELFRKNPAAFDLVLTDQTMPHLTGFELAQKMLEIKPDVPILLCTGYSDTISETQVKNSGIRELLTKPIAADLLVAVIHAALKHEKRQ